MRVPHPGAAWVGRYYDFNVWGEEIRVEKLRYMHRNPLVRGLVAKPEEWAWSSSRHYATGVEGTVGIESEWTARKANSWECGPWFAPGQSSGSGPGKAMTGHPHSG